MIQFSGVVGSLTNPSRSLPLSGGLSTREERSKTGLTPGQVWGKGWKQREGLSSGESAVWWCECGQGG